MDREGLLPHRRLRRRPRRARRCWPGSPASCGSPTSPPSSGSRWCPRTTRPAWTWPIPRTAVSKIFKLHRDTVFADFARRGGGGGPGLGAHRARHRRVLVPVHLQDGRRLGPALAPGLLVLPLRAGAPRRRRLAGRDGGDAAQRVPARPAGVAHRAGAHATSRTAGPAPTTATSRSSTTTCAPRSRCSWTRATCWSSTAT